MHPHTTPHIALLHTGIRGDEKLIIQAAARLGVTLTPIDVRKAVIDSHDTTPRDSYDVFVERCVSTSRGNALIDYLALSGKPIINTKQTKEICTDKMQTATLLAHAGVPVVRTLLAFDEAGAKDAVSTLGGYPVVLKSREGSRGRLIAKVNDDDALEALLDHRSYMGPSHGPTIIQEFVDKQHSRDIRAFVIDGTCICAIYRTSEHRITNTARGGTPTNCPVDERLQSICAAASDALGGGLLAMDVFETDNGYVINEINHTMEFKNSETPTGVSISEAIVSYCVQCVS